MPEEKQKKQKTSHERLPPLGHASTNGGGGPHIKEWVEMNAVQGPRDRTRLIGSNSSDYQDFHNTTLSLNTSRDSYGSVDRNSYTISQNNTYDFDVADDAGPHREMAVDVPDNFIATVKSAPRYPPAWPSSGDSTMAASRMNQKNKHSEDVQRYQNVPSTKLQPSPTSQELERQQRHQEALKKRREEEKKLHEEEEFLRASLRESKKLKALENNRQVELPAPVGLLNTGYDDEDDGIGGGDIKLHSRTLSETTLEESYLKKNVGVDEMFSCLHHLRNCLTSPEHQSYLSFVRILFQNEHFQQAVNLHHQLVELTCKSPPIKPVSDEAEISQLEVQHHLATASAHHGPAQDLLSILNKSNLKSLLRTHDTVSQQMQRPSEDGEESEEPEEYPLVQYGEDTVRIIHLEKTNEPLGATVKNEGEAVIIGRIVKGGVAEKSGLLQEGDEVLEVNGISMRGRNINDVSELLANMSGTITFMIIPAHHNNNNNKHKSNKVMHLRALFCYEPEDDPYIPCRELGISFLKGDILHAIALDDPNWWQAFREGEQEQHNLAGLIPSKSFAEQCEALKISAENKENKKKRVCSCGKKDHKNKRRKKPHSSGSDDSDEILTYEEITRYYPEPNRKRPIVLIGPSNVGRNELQQRLLDSDMDRFGAPVPHTTCPPRSSELQDGTFSHISRVEFTTMIQQNQFLEYGHHQKHLYGTSLESVRQVIAQGKVCLLKVQPETLKVIRASDLMPYIVFVRPPNLDKLWRLQDQLKTPVVNGIKKGKEVSVGDQLRDIIDSSREMEDMYGHLFDFVLVNSDLDQAYRELLAEINRIEVEPQWVPMSWVSPK